MRTGNCTICGERGVELHQHHVTPRTRGGSKGDTIGCCFTCSQQVHMLFTEKELEKMTLEELAKQPEMTRCVRWKKKHPGQHTTKMSKRVEVNKMRRPACPINVYSDADVAKGRIDDSKCDYDAEFRFCTGACKKQDETIQSNVGKTFEPYAREYNN